MNLSQSFRMAIKSIISSKMRSFLTMLGIIIGVCAVIILVTLIQGLQDMIKEQYERMGTNKISINYWDWSLDLTDEIYDFCTTNPDLFIGFTPEVNDYGTVKYQQKSINNVNVMMGSDQYDSCNNWEIDKGRSLSYADIKYREKVCVIGSATHKKLFNYMDPIGKTIRFKGEDFTIIGIYKEKFDSESEYTPDNIIVIPYTLQRTILKTDRITSFSARAASSEAAVTAVDELRAFLRPNFNNEWDYNVYSNQEWIDQSNDQMNIMALILGGIAGISLLVGGIGIMNIMLVSVTERTREIGIRKAIGANRRSIISQFLIEAATLSAVGGLIGILIGILGSMALGQAIFQFIITPKPLIMAGAFLFSAGLGVFFGFYPAAKASKLHPIEALRAD